MRPIEDRFWAKVDRRGPDECWLWTASTITGGYGQIGRGRAGAGNELAHRLSYAINVGPIPEGLVVMHSCDNKLCVNPAHLSVGTQKENVADMDAKGRGRRVGLRGTDSPSSKLTWTKVRRIRNAYERGALQVDLAEKFGVGQPCISSIVRGATWVE